jgi:DNA repair protein RecN (Recombination protein N)
MDEKRLNTVQDRLSLGYKLLKKHNATETKQLLSIQQDLQIKISKVLDLDGDIEKIAKEVKKNDEVTTKIANTLTAGRRKVILNWRKRSVLY